jgi:hypothetical protein
MITRTLIRAAVLPLLAAAAIPMTLAAQQPTDRAARADAFFEQASQMEQAQAEAGISRHVRDVARLYLKSASLREVSDPMRIESLHRAGTLLYTVNPKRAQRILGEAAELALIHGNVVRSAHSFLDAAAVVDAKQIDSEGARIAANRYVTTARTLADSPVLSVQQRDAILRRIETGSVAMHTR